MQRIAALAFALAPLAAAAQSWPPPPAVEARMHELQGVLANRDSSAAQRQSAREELSGLLRSPALQSRGPAAEERPARRASIEPIPRIVRPAENPRQFQPPVARVDVVDPPKPMVVPQTGSVAAPSGTFAIDPRTGAVLHQIPGGFVDPRTGQVVPR